MRVEEWEKGDIAIISLDGKMVGNCDAEALHREVQLLLEKAMNKIVIDLRGVQWMGSLCIGAVMREIISTRKREGDIYLASMSDKVRRLFHITKLDAVVNIYPSIDKAVEAFNGRH